MGESLLEVLIEREMPEVRVRVDVARIALRNLQQQTARRRGWSGAVLVLLPGMADARERGRGASSSPNQSCHARAEGSTFIA